ncbi:UvrD-helicase domain-containing protein [Streptomyces roseoverticillatus]|uniref:nuclease-related domain-containing DEAD/DEAH box helicase n=1 Tax=Streptomyces roseoverticillatus TaxID=66429 RepID=UPI001F38BA67|nr:UvrD-helicase domain-containing protein [Streptomyces roseoverticillatus]MCF3101952.1 UvrD-helicase domain-containing protein [Streptomyces roseoverticillatus]
MGAGGSAWERAQEARQYERELREQLRAAQWEVRNWEAASEGERQVAAKLQVLTRRGWRLLLDRRWPGTRAANVDMLLVGPGGVFVIDVKNWRHAPGTAGGHLTAGGRTYDGEIGKLLRMTRTAENAITGLNLSPVAVQPLMVFAGWSVNDALGTVRLLGEREVTPALVAERTRLRPADVRAVADHLERAFPAYESTAAPSRPAPARAPATDGPDDALFDAEGIRNAALEAARSAPIEQWMTFLHPEQLALVRRNWSGPARVSGPAGTGKTVVALHRAAYLAARTSGRIRYVTYANNLPRVQGTFLRTMAPAVADRVDFSSLHAWAGQFLRDRGVASRLDPGKTENAFSWAWKSHGRGTILETLDPAPGYWQDEIDYVIKGRGITAFEEYASLRRWRRRTNLRRPHREAVWALYEEYERNLAAKGVHDFNDLLALALHEALAHPGATPYTSVVADEVQDLTFVGVRLLHALVGDADNGLLLVGDGQQAVYPGGFRLSDAGIDVRGRGQVLRTNYRNAKEILDAALAVVADDSFDDIDGTPMTGHRDVDLAYGDGRVTRFTAPTRAEHDEALLAALRELGPVAWPDTAVLCRTGTERERYRRLLTRAGIPAITLEQYDGRPVPGVKLGSYHRAKGLEFKHVHLPDHDAPAAAGPGDGTDDGVARERRELHRSQLFVAMTRARDTLWLGTVSRPQGG